MTTTRTTTGMLHAIQQHQQQQLSKWHAKHDTKHENDDDNAPNDDVGVPDSAGWGTQLARRVSSTFLVASTLKFYGF